MSDAPNPQPQPTDATYADLNAGEVEWLKINLDWLTEAGWDGTGAVLQELYDRLVSAWQEAPELERPEPSDLINAAGIGLGDILARDLGLHWQVYTDAEGSELALYGAEEKMTLFPIATVARLFQEGSTGWVQDWLARMTERVQEVRDAAAAPLDATA